ncbi:nicotinate phosphoribosyltransferase [Alphaproteobacteria bacterium]|nr:nicotinate phosphoribosyltransferase [Alphaproteobacteria bacterium]MDB9872025.1 nicotinate phosphoribosyltransferase [Alphaproteobacteria bacterium]
MTKSKKESNINLDKTDEWPIDLRPSPDQLPSVTDTYFLRTRDIVSSFGDTEVTYAIFMRRPVISALNPALDWLQAIVKERNSSVNVNRCFNEGDDVGAGEPMVYLSGSFLTLVDLETALLQKIGATCVAAYNAKSMVESLRNTSFLAMDARHCAGTDMADLMAYGASVGSKRVKSEGDAIGFIGCATDRSAHMFEITSGLGTMPHALVGYAGSTLKAAQMFNSTWPNHPLTVLIDYFGKEITDGLMVCRAFKNLAKEGTLSLRLDTHGGRYIEGLDVAGSYAVLERNIPEAIRGYRNEQELRYLIGTGVSAAAIWHLREMLDNSGFKNVKIVASSGFGPEKCKVFSLANVPVDVIGTGSYLPSRWSETYATADIISYGGKSQVKLGREFLLKR